MFMDSTMVGVIEDEQRWWKEHPKLRFLKNFVLVALVGSIVVGSIIAICLR